MAKTDTGNSSLPSEPIAKCFDANQAETVEDNTCTWNEQLEKELLRVLGSLDDELAREQSQEATNKRTPVHYDSRATELKHYPTFTPHSVHGEVQKNDQGMFFSDGTRTLRAQDERRTFSRPRLFYDTYMKRHHSAGYVYGDTYERTSPVLRRGYSSRSLGHSSGGSLQLHSGPYNSGFGHTTFTVKDAGNRSCSLSCLARGQSLASIDQLSNATLRSPLENSKGITQRNYYQQTKRTPLSSIVWNTPQSSENSYKDQLLRTRSLMEFGPTCEDTEPYSPQENTSYDFYRSKVNYRRAVPNATHSIFPDQHVDPLYLDNRENYLLHQMERSNMKYPYRYPLFRRRANMPHKSFPSGRTEEQFFRPNSQQYYSNEVFLASDADIERIPSNLNNWPNAYTEESYLPTWEHDNIWGIDYSEGVRDRLFSKYPDGIHRHTACGQANHAVQQNLLAGAGQSPSKSFVNNFQANTNFQTHASDEMRIPDCNLPDRMENESFKGGKVRLVSEQRDINSATETHMSPMKSSSVALQHSLRKPTKLTSVRNIENMYLSNIHKREGPRNQDNFAVNRSLNQMNPFYLTAKSTRAMNQNLQQERHQSETLGGFVCNKTNQNTCSAIFSKGPEAFPHDRLSDSCTENIHKHDRFVKHVTSNSITGSPLNSPPKSPTTDYILPRKSASIDGSVLSEKPVSQFHPTRQIPYRNKINVEDDLEALRSNKIENMYSHKKDKTTLLSPVHSSLCSSSKDITQNEVPENKEYHLQLTQDSKHSFDGNIVSNKLEKQILCDPDKSEISVSSECEETDSRNPLKQYKTTSTLTVSIEEDNVKYHELISVYYTLPRKCSRTLFNLFLDDAKKDAGSVSSTRKSLPQQSNLATVTFPSSSEKENKNDSLCKVAAASGVQHNSKMIGNVNEEGTLILNTTVENAATSLVQSKMHNKDEAAVSSTEEPEFLFSNRTASLGLLSDPKPSKTMDDALSTLTNTLSNQHIDRYPFKKGSKKDKPLTSNLSDSTDNKTSSGTLVAPSFAMDTQKRSLLPCLPSTEPAANNSSPIPPSHLIDINKEGKNTAGSEINTTKNYMKYNISQETEVKEKYHNNSQKADELQINKNVRSGRQEALTSETKVCSDFQKQNPLVDVAFTANSIFPPNKSVSEYRKPAQECEPQNYITSKVCKTSQRSVKNSTDDQNPNSKDQLVNTTQDLSDNSASENKLMPHCTKDKTSDIEKRKNRLSIKNKLAAIYKTSRKFSSKKSLTPKPHISNIFSQNDAPFSEDSSSDMPQLCLQTESENQNQNPLANEFDHTALNKPEDKKLQTNEGSSLITNEIRRPFANLCNQKHGSPSPGQSDKKTGDKQNSTVLFSKEIMPKLNNKGLENNNQLSSRIKDAHRNQKLESDSKVGDPVGSGKNSNIRIANYSNAASRLSQEVISPTEADHYQHTKHSDRLRNPNISCVEPVLNPSKVARERHFSESSYTQVLHDPLASGGNIMHSGSRYKRMFKSQSELLSCDENESWGARDDNNRTLGSRRVMYPSIEFGIFGKEQQQAFLDNIKRSLTEGRLWRPSFLNSHHSLRKGEVISLSRSEQLTSGFAERKVSVEGTSPQIYTEAQGDYSESDSDTTTDDEYYLNENDKESEL